MSSDVYFYSLGNDSWALYKSKHQVGPNALQDEIAKLGIGKKTGIDLPAESSGRLPDPSWLKQFDLDLNGHATAGGRWSSGSSINLAIGQGDVLVTPLQMANAYAAFANGGTLYQPTVVSKITEYGRPDKIIVEHQKAKTLGTVDWPADIHAALLTGFEGVPETGTAKQAFLGFPDTTWPAAGKTGTAQSGDKNHRKEDHSWFVGFGPEPDVRYVAAMIMEHSGAGGSASAPAVRRIFEAIATNQLDQIDLTSLADPNALGALKAASSTGTTGDTGTTEGTGTTTSTTALPGTTGEGTTQRGTGTMTSVPGGTPGGG